MKEEFQMFKKVMFLMVVITMVFLFPMTVTHAVPERLEILSSISFELDSSTNTQNARRASQLIDGTIVNPGQEFSFNNTTGQRTRDKGFIVGHFPYWDNGRVIDGSAVGSGVCRTSTGVHLAALRAGLKITERWSHDVAVGYVRRGEDAAVNWGDADMRFVNDKPFPIRIVIIVDSDNFLRAQIIKVN